MQKTLARICLVLLGTLMATLVVEGGVRLWTLFVRGPALLPYEYGYEELARLEEGGTYLMFDKELGWTIRPSTSVFNGEVTYRSNSLGIRSEREFAPKLESGRIRITAFGDSFTHCDDVDFPDCWSSFLEESWPRAEVINYGVSGFAPDQAYLRYQREGQQFESCAVIIGFMAENVNRLVNRFRPFYQPQTGINLPKPRFTVDGDRLELIPTGVDSLAQLQDRAWVERTLGPGDYWYYPNLLAPHPLDASYVYRAVRSAAYRRYTDQPAFALTDERRLIWSFEHKDEAYQVARAILIDFGNRVKQDGKTPVVVFFPRKTDVVAERQGRDRIYEPLIAELEQAEIAAIDLADPMARETRRVGVDSIIGKHYRPRANRVAGEALARRLPKIVAPTCGA
jgi:hypothetical protein